MYLCIWWILLIQKIFRNNYPSFINSGTSVDVLLRSNIIYGRTGIFVWLEFLMEFVYSLRNINSIYFLIEIIKNILVCFPFKFNFFISNLNCSWVIPKHFEGLKKWSLLISMICSTLTFLNDHGKVYWSAK